LYLKAGGFLKAVRRVRMFVETLQVTPVMFTFGGVICWIDLGLRGASR